MIKSTRVFQYMNPEQKVSADLLLRQNNKCVFNALCSMEQQLSQMSSDSSIKLKGVDRIAWWRYFRPNGEEWYVCELDLDTMSCLYYNGEFRERIFDPFDVRMKMSVALDIYWTPKSFKEIMENHQCCEKKRWSDHLMDYQAIMSRTAK